MDIKITKIKIIRKMPMVFALLFCITSYAVGPNLPVGFDTENAKDLWTVGLLAEKKLLDKIKVQVWLYQRDKILDKRELDISADSFQEKDKTGRFYTDFSLKADELNQLSDGFYSQKIILQVDQLEKDSNKPLIIQRWAYLQASENEIKPLTMERYSKLTDPTVSDVNYEGKQIEVYQGWSEKLAVDLRETKSSEAIQLGRLSGLKPERAIQEEKNNKQDERDED